MSAKSSTLLSMKKIAMLAFLALIVCVHIISAFASDLENALKQQYEKQVLGLRSPLQGTHLEFDSSGKPLGQSPQGRWIAYGGIYVQKISLAADKLRLEGPLAGFGADSKQGKPEIVPLGKAINVEIQLDHPANSVDDVRAVLDCVFFLDDKDHQHDIPEFRRADFVADEKIYRLGKDGVSDPVAIHTPEPEFTDESRRKGLRHGIVVLEVVVDKSGTVSRIRLVRPMSLGLDEGAVEAIKTWRFQPAKRSGEPVAVLMNIEVSFDRD